jgi:hypothetical protein
MSSFFNQAKIINVYYNKGDRKPYDVNGKPIAYIGEESIGSTEATTLRFYLGENIDSSTAIIVTKRADGERRIDICLKVENGVDSYYQVTLNSWYSQVKGKATLVFKVYNGDVEFDSEEMPTEILSVEGRIIVSDIFNLEIAYAPDSDFVVPPDDVPEYAQWFLALSQKLDKVDSITVDIALPEPLEDNNYNNRYFFIQNEGVGKLFYIDGNEPIEVVWGVGTIQLTPSGNGDVVAGLEAGKLYWSEDRGTIVGGLYDDQVVGIGDGFFWFVKASEAISKGDVVQFAGNVGGQIVVKKAVFAEITTQPDLLMGVAKHSIANGNKGYIVAIGRLDNINTSGFSTPILYLSTTTAGQLTSTKPTNGFKGSIAAIGRASTEGGSNGFLLVRPNFIKGINEATDVLITSLTNKDILRWNSTSGRWENNADLTDLETNLQDYKDDIADGTIIVGKAENDKDGNEFDATYLKKTTASSTYLTQANASSTYLTQANATAIYIPLSQKSIPNGVATLGVDGRVLPSQLPGSIGEVLEYPSLLDFPEEGAAEKIFIAVDTNKTYRWSGTQYVEISQSLALGETTETAFAGSRGVALETLTDNIVDGTQGLTDTRITNSATTIQPLIVNGVVDTTADLLRLQVGSVNALEVTKDGIINKSVANSVVITQNNVPILSTFKHPTGSTAVPDGFNTFVGRAGNTTMGSTATNTAHASYNTAVGVGSLRDNTTGFANSVLGFDGMLLNTTGNNNSAFGYGSLFSNTTGGSNTGIGRDSGRSITTGSNNTFVGRNAGNSGAWGTQSATISNSTAIGYESFTDASNQMVFGNASVTQFKFDRNSGAVLVAPNIGIGTASPVGKLDIQSSRTTAYDATAVNNDFFRIRNLHNSGGTNQESGLSLYVSSDNGSTNGIVQLSAIAPTTSSNTADFAIRTRNAGVMAERMRILADGKVGIGTTSPTQRLQLNDSGANQILMSVTNSSTGSGAEDGLHVGIGGSGDAFIWNKENTHTAFGTNNTERMRIASNGNVGIGTTSPASYGAGYRTLALSNTDGAVIDFMAGASRIGTIYTDTTYTLSAVTSIPMRFMTNDTERMRIDSAGLVGIGTTSPTAKLTVSGTDVNSAIDFNNTFTSTGRNYRWVSLNTGGFAVEDMTANAERLRIASDGNVGIGRTSPQTKLEVSADLTETARFSYSVAPTSYYLRVRQTNPVSAVVAWNFDVRNNDSQFDNTLVLDRGNVGVGTATPGAKLAVVGGDTLIEKSGGGTLSLQNPGVNAYNMVGGADLNFYANGGANLRMNLTNGGALYNTTGTYGTISDIRVKENIVTARDYTEDLMKLRVVKYSLKEEKAIKPTKLGFIAQEVEKIFPNMIENTKRDGLNDFKQIKTSILIPMLVKTIQRLNARITALEKGEPAPVEPIEPEEPVVETTPEPEFEPITNFEYDENE